MAADIQIILEVLGAQDMEKAGRLTTTLTNKINSLGNQLRKGTIDNRQFQIGVQQLIKKNAEAAGGYSKLQKEVQRYAFSLQRSINDQARAEAAIENTTQAIQTQTAAVSKAAVAQNRMSVATQGSTRRIGQGSTIIQQSGYQIGDFIVQVQSGTNAFVAFGQQATQVAGTLTLLGGKMVPIGAILSVVIPLATAFGAAWMRTRQEVEDAADEFERFSQSLKSLEDSVSILSMDVSELGEKYGDAADKVREFAVAQAEVRVALAENRLRDTIEGLDEILDRYTALSSSGALLSPAMDELERSTQMGVDAALELQNAFGRLSQAQTFTVQQMALQDIVRLMGEFGVEASSLPPELQEALDKFFSMAIEAEELRQAVKNTNDAAEDVVNSTDGITSSLSRAVSEATLLRDTLASVSRAALSRQDQITVLRSQISAARAGASVSGAEAQTETALEMARGGATADQIAAAALAAGQQAATIESLESELSALLRPPSGGGGGGGGGAAGPTSIFPELQAQVEAAMEKTKAYEKEIKLLDFALDKGMITQERYNQAVARAQEFYGQAADAATNYEDILLKMANTTSDALGDAMMSIVDGTKSASDAFSDMTQIILKKAFELLVINPILNSIFGGSGLNITGFTPLPSLASANGNVFSGGNVQAFANGGVVGSPTFFPMANGGVGLMGEAGPEAIMPLKRGKGGRLGVEVSGEQGNVTINQTFAFSANGDDSVKKIIAQEAPKIAALTQKQMLDARRRGGVVRDTFA